MLLGSSKTIIIAAVTALTLPALAGDPFLEQAARQMDEDTQSTSTPGSKTTPAADKTETTDDAPEDGASFHIHGNLDKAVSHVRDVIDDHGDDHAKLREAYKILREARRRAGEVPDPRIEALVGELALIDGRPERAMTYVKPLTPADPKTLAEDDFWPLFDPLFIRGRASLDAAVLQAKTDLRKARRSAPPKPSANDFFGIPVGEDGKTLGIDIPDEYMDLAYLGVPLDAKTEKPALSEAARAGAHEALVIFDHLTGKDSPGVRQALSAYRCGQSLALLGRYDDAIDAFGFASHTLRAGESDLSDRRRKIDRMIRAERRKVAYLRDVTWYSLEYMLYREAQKHRLSGHYKEAIKTYRQCIDSAQTTMTRELIASLPDDRSVLTDKVKAEIKVEESPYTAAARLYEGMCYIELGQVGKGIHLLKALVADSDPGDPATPALFRGEAMLTLGKMYLDGRAGKIDRQQADDWLFRLEEWIKLARKDNTEWDFAKLLPGVRKAAKRKTDGPVAEKSRDMWGNIVEETIDPGMLVNRKTTPWYLDDLEENCAKFRGFLLLADGHGEQALKQFRRITKLDSFAAEGDRGIDPNDFTRLKFGADHGYLIAYPQEQIPFDDNLRYVILLADLHYASSDFDEARDIYEAMLDGRYGKLTAQQKDYPRFAAGLCHFRSRDSGKAIARWAQVIEQLDGTYTEFRAAYAIGHLSRYAAGPDLRRRGQTLMFDLAKSKANNQFTRKARITVAMDLAEAGKTEEALGFLELVDEGDPGIHQLAAYLTKHSGRVNLPPTKLAAQKPKKGKTPVRNREAVKLADLPKAEEGGSAERDEPGAAEAEDTGAETGQQEEKKDENEGPTFFGI